MSNKVYLFLIFLIFASPGLNAQNIERWIETNEKVPVEKIYLHTDREYYFTGETIWLKSYLTDSRSGKLIPGAENIFIQLIDENGNSAISANLMSINGQVPGHIDLPDTLKPGNYLLQAFTDYLLNFGTDAFFHKTIGISQAARSPGAIEARQRTNPPRRMVADVSFLPEGGKLLEGISNLVAFKAIDQNGYGIDARGSVRDASGAEVVTFNTDYKGMGIFFMTPEPGKSYQAIINGFPAFRFNFDSLIVSEGVKIQLVNQTSRELFVNISGNSEKFSEEPFFLVNMHRGETVFYQAFIMVGQNHLLKFESNMLKEGINQLVLLDKNLRPVSERLLFSDNTGMNKVAVNAGKDRFAALTEVKLMISEDKNPKEASNLSVAVVHESAFAENGVSHHILSELLISSELNGFIESPAEYFTDNEINATVKQRLLMLTNGWSSYFWNSVPGNDESLEYKQTAGLELRGVANEISSGQPLVSGEITLVIEKDREMAILTKNTDSLGHFAFSGLLFNDTASVYVQAKNDQGRQNTTISLMPSYTVKAPFSNILALKGPNEIPFELAIQKYNHNREYSEYLRKQGTVSVPQESQSIENKNDEDGHFRIYDRADQVITVPETEASFGNILDFLAGKVAGLDISSDQVTIRGTSNFDGNSTPLFLVDGVPVSINTYTGMPGEVGQSIENEQREIGNSAIDKIKSIPVGDVDKVEILKSPQNLAMFGVEGANGVIAVYTRKGKTEIPAAVKGVIGQKMAGYTSFRRFYSPKYLPENRNIKSPDFRTTLFWEPEIILQNGTADLSFFTSEQTGKYKVIVEGISESGKICVGNTEFEVIDEPDN